MKLAQRMSRIGVEGAFEVLARARALEAQGRDIIHLEIGEPDFATPRHIVEAAKKALGRGLDALRPDARACPNCARPSPGTFAARAESKLVPEQRLRRARRQADHLFPDAGSARAGRRGDLSESRLPDLRIDDQFSWRDAGADPARGRTRFLLRFESSRAEALRQDQAADSEFAAQSRPAA